MPGEVTDASDAARVGSQRGYASVIDEITKLGRLKPGWNTYGAGPVDEAASLQAVALVHALVDWSIPPPSVAPTSNGGVALTWSTRDREVQVIVLAQGGVYSVVASETDDVICEGRTGDVDVVNDVIRPFVGRPSG